MSFREPIKVLADVIQEEMSLADGQIMLAYEKWEIPKNPGMYVALNYVSSKPIGQRNYFDPTTSIEEQSSTVHHVIQIDVMSFDSSARMRKEEIFMALTSMFSQQAQEENNLQIAMIPSDFVNTSSLEETKIMNRFTMTIAVTSTSRKVKKADYFDQFATPEVTYND